MDKETKLFFKGIHNVIPDTEIPSDAASSSSNWITKDGSIILAGGRQIVGSAGTIGKINGLWTGYNTKGDKVIYRKITDKIQVLVSGTWTDVLTGLTDIDCSFANYSSLAGAFTFINCEDGYWVINNANPTTAVDIYDSSKNFKGYILIDRGRTILWNRAKDKTGLYGSYIDKQNSTVYTAVTSEAIGALGTKNYTGTLAFKAGGAKRISFGVSFTATVSGGNETFTDNYDGTLTSDQGGTGVINYATGAYDITFFKTTTGAVTSNYQWQDQTVHGLADFTKSATRLAGEGFQFPQDEGGDAILNVLIGQDGGYYSLKENSAYSLILDAADTNAENLVYRKDMGIANWRCAVSTSKGIVFINTANPLDPKLTILRKNQLGDSIEPVVLCSHFDFANYDYDDASMDTYERYVIIACKTKGSDNNDVILFVNVQDATVDIVKYESRVFTKDGIKLYVGSPITQDVYEILVGFDDEGLSIQNEWISKGENYGSQFLKKLKKMRFKGYIDPDQKVEVWGDIDNSGYSLLGVIDGQASYVDYTANQTIGSNFIGGSQLGGDDSTDAYYFFCEIKVKMSKFCKRNIKFIATGIGYVELQYTMDKDVLNFTDKIPYKYRNRTTQISVGDDIVIPPGATSTIGDVQGPQGAVDNNVVFFDGVTGKKIKDSGLTLSGSNTGDETTSTIKTKLGITVLSGDNTGDNATNSQYSGLATSKQDTLVSGLNIKTINSTSLLGSGDLILPGVGDVVGPSSSVDNAIARFDNVTGKIIQSSSAIIDDSGNIGLGDVTSPVAKIDIQQCEDEALYAKRTCAFNFVQYRRNAGAWTDITTEAAISLGTVSGDILDLIGDAFYVGKTDQFSNIYIDIGTALGGTVSSPVLVWEYSTGSNTWATLTVTDGTATTYTLAQDGVVAFTPPVDWAVDSQNSSADMYFVRVRVVSGTFSTEPTVYLVVPSLGKALVEMYANSGDPSPSICITRNGNVTMGYGNTSATPSTYKLAIAGTLFTSSSITASSSITGTTINGTTGINTGASAGTQRIDASGNLVNIGTITSGLINGQTISSAANFTGTLNVNGTTTLATTGGNVGIGTTTPVAKLDVNGNTIFRSELNSANYFNIRAYADNYKTMTLYVNSSEGESRVLTARGNSVVGAYSVVGVGPSSWVHGWGVPGNIFFRGDETILGVPIFGEDGFTGGTHKSLAIGTPQRSPSAGWGTTDTIDLGTFSIAANTWGGVRPSLRYTALDHNFRVNNTTGSGNPGTSALFIKSDANVGIGTTTPSEKLVVSGNLLSTGVISATGGNSTNWNTAYNWGNHATAGYLTSATAASTYLSLATWNSTTTLPSNIVNSSLTKVGALTSGSISTGFGTILTSNTITGTSITSGISSTAGTYALGFAATASSAATSGTTVQNSPVIRFSSQAWNTTVTAATKINAMDIGVVPTSGTTTSARMIFKNTTVDGVANATELACLTTGGQFGVGTSTFLSTGNVINAYASNAGTAQINVRNGSNGTSASSDLVATADTGTDSTNYIDIGINSSTYNDAAFNIGGALTGYVYSRGGDLTVGTATATKIIKFHTGGTTSTQLRASISDTVAYFAGNLGVGIDNPTVKLDVVGQGKFSSTLFPVVDIIRDTEATGSSIYGGAKLERLTSSPTAGGGIGFYFKYPDSAGNSTFAGIFGGALSTVTNGSEVGQIVIAASWQGADPASKQHLVVKATGTDTGDVIIPNGNLELGGNMQLGEASIKLDAVLSADEKWSGITIAGTLGATIAVGDLCYLNADDSRWELVDANLSDGYDKQLGICLVGGNDGGSSEFLVFGKVRSAAFPAFTVGSPLYMSETAGDMTHTAPTTADSATRLLGFALTAEDMLFNPSTEVIIYK